MTLADSFWTQYLVTIAGVVTTGTVAVAGRRIWRWVRATPPTLINLRADPGVAGTILVENNGDFPVFLHDLSYIHDGNRVSLAERMNRRIAPAKHVAFQFPAPTLTNALSYAATLSDETGAKWVAIYDGSVHNINNPALWNPVLGRSWPSLAQAGIDQARLSKRLLRRPVP